MKQVIKTTLAAMAGMVVGMGIMFATASGVQPGSEQDPLVTRSYVDQRIAALIAGGGIPAAGVPIVGAPAGSEEVARLQKDVGELTHFIIDALTGVERLGARINALEAGYVVVEVPAGRTLLLHGGSEVIVRSGVATAVQGTQGGLANVTTGTDIKGGTVVNNQHLLISSRSDGRGLRMGNSTVFLLVRGGYTLQ